MTHDSESDSDRRPESDSDTEASLPRLAARERVGGEADDEAAAGAARRGVGPAPALLDRLRRERERREWEGLGGRGEREGGEGRK